MGGTSDLCAAPPPAPDRCVGLPPPAHLPTSLAPPHCLPFPAPGVADMFPQLHEAAKRRDAVARGEAVEEAVEGGDGTAGEAPAEAAPAAKRREQ